MNKYPFVKQTGITDCGPACLLMILKYYNGNESLEKIKLLAKTDKLGTNAYNLINAAKKLGFNCNAYKTSIDTLTTNKDIKFPLIAHTIINNKYLHYVVIYSINNQKQTITYADPSSKIKTISYKDFYQIYNNVIVTFNPTKNILNKKYHSINKLILKTIKTNYKHLFRIWILSFITILLTIYILLYTKISLDNLNSKFLLSCYILLIIIIVIKYLFERLLLKVKINLSNNIEYQLMTNVYEKTFSFPYQYYCNHSTGEIIKQINDLENTKETIMLLTLTLLLYLPLSLMAFILMFVISKKLFIISLLGLFINIFILNINRKKDNEKLNNVKLLSEEINGYLYNTISKINSILGLSIENNIIKIFQTKFYSYLKYLSKTLYKLKTKENLINSINLLIDGTIIYIGCHLIINNKINISSLISFISIKEISFSPITHIFQNNINIKEGILAIKRFKELDNIVIKNNKETKKLKGNIHIKRINHKYNYDKKINIKTNLKIKSGEKVIIIGESGSGKTTLFNLLYKHINTPKNTIYIDTHDINELTKYDIKENIVYIPEEEFILLEDINTNITLNSEVNNLDEIKEICLLKELNYNNELSGGERQKIVLARALTKEFKILLIDEGLNKLDINTERKILKNLFDKLKDKTIIIISHRIDNIDLFDKVVEIKNNNMIIKDKRR